jgi:hypothetical protein
MPVPNVNQPFFAYGIFRPGQLAFFQLRDFVSDVSQPVEVPGSLRIRDGLPIVDPEGPGYINGALLMFRPHRAADAYKRISDMEPDQHYRWYAAQAGGGSANMLVGKSPGKGSAPCEDAEWNGWKDPLFTAALDVVQETLADSQEFGWDLKPLFRLQMAYLLLWTAIERYVSLRYYLGPKVAGKVGQLADESAFVESLQKRVTRRREVFRADRPTDKEVLDPQLPPGRAIDYYYQVRSNITHRGKSAVRDYEMLQESLAELLEIFREVLKAAEYDARVDPEKPAGDDSKRG